MVNVQQAWQIVKKDNPNMDPFTCNETKDCFMFSLKPKNLAKDDFYASGGVFTVDKISGKYDVIPWFIANEKPVVRTIDVSMFD